MTDLIDWLMNTPGFVQRTQCGVGWIENPGLTFATQISDFGIFFCYLLIPTCLQRAYVAWTEGRILRDPKTGSALFIGFILTCGLTHFMDRLLFHVPAYGLDCVIRLVCLLFSFMTVMWMVSPGRFVERKKVEHGDPE